MTLLNGKNINRGYSKRRNITNCRTLLSALYAFLLLLISFSCQKSPINGDLDGQWQVMDVSPEPLEKPIGQRIYYCFSLHVCQLTYYDGVFTAGNMAFDGKTLRLDFPYATSYVSREKLRQYGINENPITFTVEHLDKKSLILKHGDTTVTMRKF